MTTANELWRRVEDRIDGWRVRVEHVVETDGSILAFGQRDNQSVVLKVIRHDGDEWRSGDVLTAFEGQGVVRVLDHVDGAALLERLRPGDPLVSMALNGSDDEATGILAGIIGMMSPTTPPRSCSTVQDWGGEFERHAVDGDALIPRALLESAQRIYSQLCASQTRTRLLHGDLHHYNVLLDAERGWLAIDPKGVVGEPEYEIGAALRNPYECPQLFTDRATIERRVDRFRRELHLDAERILAWAFSQAVLACIWAVDDGFTVGPDHAWLALANNIRPML